jgi:RNA polymerase sigma factor (sigma-70 family)
MASHLRLVPKPTVTPDENKVPTSPELTDKQRLLVKAGGPLVRSCASYVAGLYGSLVTPAELLGPGTIALHEAALAYRSDLHPVFPWYAKWHVWGRRHEAVKADHFSRSARVERAMERGFARFASHLILDGNLFNDTEEQARESARRSGDDALAAAVFAAMIELHQPSPEAEAIAREEREATLAAVQKAIGALHPHERQVIEMVYYRQMTLDEVGRELSTTARMAQRRHKEVIRKLKKFLLEEGTVTSLWPNFDYFP